MSVSSSSLCVLPLSHFKMTFFKMILHDFPSLWCNPSLSSITLASLPSHTIPYFSFPPTPSPNCFVYLPVYSYFPSPWLTVYFIISALTFPSPVSLLPLPRHSASPWPSFTIPLHTFPLHLYSPASSPFITLTPVSSPTPTLTSQSWPHQVVHHLSCLIHLPIAVSQSLLFLLSPLSGWLAGWLALIMKGRDKPAAAVAELVNEGSSLEECHLCLLLSLILSFPFFLHSFVYIQSSGHWILSLSFSLCICQHIPLIFCLLTVHSFPSSLSHIAYTHPHQNILASLSPHTCTPHTYGHIST